MPKYTLSLGLYLLLAMEIQAQHIYDGSRRFPADTIKKSIQDIVKELALKHPGFYRYHSKDQFAWYVDSVNTTIIDSLTEIQVYRKLKPLISYTGCLHTGLKLSKQYNDYLNAIPNLFPFQLFVQGQRAFIINNYSGNPSIQPGDELLSINGRSIPQILDILLPAIPSDGYNSTMKYLALYHSFPTWYRSMVEIIDSFSIKVMHQQQPLSVSIAAARYNDIARNGFLNELSFPKQLDFSIEDGIGRLTIHSFARSAIKKGGQQFEPFIKDAFKQLKTQNIDNLVIDLRYNTGGSDGNAAYLSSYFFDKPYRYWDRVEVTPAIAKSIKGIYTLFYRKPVQKDSLWLWRKARTVKDFNFYTVQQPAKNHYKGQVYILINGFCMSSCADVAAVLAHNKKAVFIGEETGGGYQGNNSGLMPSTGFSPTNLQLTVPLQKYYNAVDPTVSFGRGTMPDHPVPPTVETLIQQKDVVMDRAIDLVKRKKAGQP